MDHSIPLIDIGPLFGEPSLQRDLTDQAIMLAAGNSGFMVVRGFPPDVPAGREARADLLRLFQLPESETRKLWRQKFDPAHPNVYRGWFPLQKGFLTAKEGIDMGADLVHGNSVVHSGDPLREATPLPSAEALPGWREAAAQYYLAMEKLSQALMRAIARGLSYTVRERSTHRVSMPSLPSKPAATAPDGPKPTTTTSKWLFIVLTAPLLRPEPCSADGQRFQCRPPPGHRAS